MAFVSLSLATLAPQIVTTLVALLLFLLILKTRRQDHAGGHRRTAPVASGGWPLLGHLPLLAGKVPPFRVLGNLADKYGPIFYIRLGRKPTLIISSHEMAKECFGTHDKVFLDRPHIASVNHAYGGAMFGLGPSFGQYWSNMRRISTHELLSNTRLDLLKHVRSEEVKTSVKHLFSTCHAGPAKVNLSEWWSLVMMNIMTQMVAGKRFGFDGKDEEEWRPFVKSMEGLMNLIGTFVVSDVVPFTEWMDLQGHFRAVKRAVKECDRFIDGWLDEHVRRRRAGKVNDEDRDFIDVMLSVLEDDPSLSSPHSNEVAIKSTVMNLIIGGAETTTIGVIWAFSYLVNNPEVLTKIQKELDTHVGKERWVEEEDMKNLVYLVATMKETMRLVVPLGVPRESTEDCVIAGYHIPKGTSLIINLWRLHHDPRVWSDPDEFRPERFDSNDSESFEVRDKSFKFLPFVAGRKSCPGLSLGMRMTGLVIARVLQGFDLATPDGQKVDMTEGVGLTNPKALPLELMLTPRLPRELY